MKQFFAKLFWMFMAAAKMITIPITKENRNEH